MSISFSAMIDKPDEFENSCLKLLGKKFNDDNRLIDYALDSIYKGCENLIKTIQTNDRDLFYRLETAKKNKNIAKTEKNDEKIKEANEEIKQIYEILNKTYNNELYTIIKNSIPNALRKQNPNLYALADKVRDILKDLVFENKIYTDDIRRHSRMYKLIQGEVNNIFRYSDSEMKNKIINYIRSIKLDTKYELIINKPQEKKKFNCTENIRKVIEDFFTVTTPPRTTADYLWKAMEGAKVITHIYNDNYTYRLKRVEEAINCTKNEIEKKSYIKEKQILLEEHRANFDIKEISIYKNNYEEDEDSNEFIDDIPPDESNNTETIAIDKHIDEGKVDYWLEETIYMLDQIKEKYGMLIYFLKILKETPTMITEIDEELKNRFITLLERNTLTPTQFFAKFLNISVGSVSNYTEKMRIFIIRRFRKINGEEYANNDSNYIEIPSINRDVFYRFWNRIARYFRQELEVRL